MENNTGRNPYEDIINLPHHVSSTRPRMPMADRAAQFSSFRALSGYGDAVKETARLTGQRIELDESTKAVLDEKLAAYEAEKARQYEFYGIETGN